MEGARNGLFHFVACLGYELRYHRRQDSSNNLEGQHAMPPDTLVINAGQGA